jgi:hypothetical protein
MIMQEHRSRLPDDPEYWDRLAERIRADAAGPLASFAATDAWYGVLSRRASWLLAAAAILIAALLLTLPRTPDADPYLWIERSLTPDERAGTLISGPAAPAVEQLLPEFPPADPGEEG